MRTNQAVLLTVICVVALCIHADARPKRVTATKMWIQEENMTGLEATELARTEAKKEVLRLAGVTEHVWSVFGMNISSDSQKPHFFNACSEQSFVFMQGYLDNYTETVRTEWNAAECKPVKIVTVTADVDTDKFAEDPTYKIRVDGIKDVYKDQETFNCQFRIYGKDSYLKLFYFNDSYAELIYPNEWSQADIYEKDVRHEIPSIFMFEKDPSQTDNYVNLIFVATKKNYPFTSEASAESIFEWIFGLAPEERAIEMKQVTIL